MFAFRTSNNGAGMSVMQKLHAYRRHFPFRNGSTATTTSTKAKEETKKKIPPALTILITSSVAVIASSVYTRQWREKHLDDVPLALDSGVFFSRKEDGDGGGSHVPVDAKNNRNRIIRRDIHDLDSIVARTGLMKNTRPGSKSVMEELHTIRAWHQARGFRGGVILRELTKPLFNSTTLTSIMENGSVLEGGDDVEPMPLDQLPQRECYYLYYEIKGNGHALHQIFCRGTTLFADLKTCLNSHLVYDDELGLHLHAGFRDHAHRLCKDVEPLLASPNNPRATVEISGHSLGGAVAMIVAMKLKKRGHNVTKVVSVAGARFCGKDDVAMANELLPNDCLRIEDDLDCVPFLPPWASSAGDKLWFVNDTSTSLEKPETSVKYIPSSICLDKEHGLSWSEDVYTNLRLPETIMSETTTHRISSHRAKLADLINSLNIAPTKSERRTSDEHSVEIG